MLRKMIRFIVLQYLQESIRLSAGFPVLNPHRACLALGACLGQWSLHETAEQICLSQSHRSSEILLEIFLELASPKNTDVIMNRTYRNLSSRSPNPQKDHCCVEHWQRMVEHKGPFRLCRVPESHNFDETVQSLPKDVCLLVIHMDQAQENIYVVAIDKNTYSAGDNGDDSKCAGVLVDRFSVQDSGDLSSTLGLMKEFYSNATTMAKCFGERPHDPLNSHPADGSQRVSWEECVVAVSASNSTCGRHQNFHG